MRKNRHCNSNIIQKGLNEEKGRKCLERVASKDAFELLGLNFPLYMLHKGALLVSKYGLMSLRRHRKPVCMTTMPANLRRPARALPRYKYNPILFGNIDSCDYIVSVVVLIALLLFCFLEFTQLILFMSKY